MVKHIIIWTLKEMPEAEKTEHKKLIKEGLEGLKGKIDGLLEIKVVTEPLPSSNGDLMLDSTFADYDALKGYSVHPEHVKVADERVIPFTADRKCLDFEII
ncbi:MAG: Dabb family protein [Oscillospiraceae bacterium]|nr:Dabb family protein [Oscillospiraceae bacterium]